MVLDATFTHPAQAGILGDVANQFVGTNAPLSESAKSLSTTLARMFVWPEIIFIGWSVISANSLEAGLKASAFAFGAIIWTVYLTGYQDTLTMYVLAFLGALPGDFALQHAGQALNPDAIASLGFDTTTKIMDAEPGNPIVDGLIAFPSFITCCIIQLAFLVVGLEDMVIYIGTSLCITFGATVLGLYIFRFTRPYVAIWPRMIFISGVLMVTIGAVASLGKLIAAHIADTITAMATQPWTGIINDLATISVEGLLYLVMAIMLVGLAGFLGASAPMSSGAWSGALIGATAGGVMRGGGSGGSGSGSALSNGASSPPFATIEAAATKA